MREQREEDARQAADRAAKEVQREQEREADRPSPDELRKLGPGVLGYLVAIQEDHRADAKAKIAEEKKYARQGGGIVDMDYLYDLQEQMRNADDCIADFRKIAKELGLKVAGRNDLRTDAAQLIIVAPTDARPSRVMVQFLRDMQERERGCD
jgi:hypothetical protein